MDRDLDREELRVLGCLIEKEATTPDQYPLSINALVQACNQKSNRDPVMSLAEADVRSAVTSLTRRGLVRQASSYGGRVNRFEHRLARGPASALDVTPEGLAILCVLMLRGPQTPGELRSRTQRLAPFADTDAIEATLSDLSARADGALVERMAREPGKREARYRHRLGALGEPAATDATAPASSEPAPGGGPAPASGPSATLESRVAALEEAVAELRARLDDRDEHA